MYEIPVSVQSCINATTGSTSETACYPASVYQEAVIAFDIDQGYVKWIKHLSPIEAWTLACGIIGLLPAQPTCPPNPGPDADFGMAPTFVRGGVNETPGGRDVVVIGQKNGNLYAMDAANGTVAWATTVSLDFDSLGALVWGVAVDNTHVYFTAQNPEYEPWTVQPSGKNISNAAYGAVCLCDGTFDWEVPVPHNGTAYQAPSVANDLVLVARAGEYALGQAVAPNSTTGSVVLLHKATGAVAAEIPADDLVYGGIAIQDEYIMFGTGYRQAPGYGSFDVYIVSRALL